MLNILDKKSLIEKEIDNNSYIDSLLNAALKYNYITVEEYNFVLIKFADLLSSKIERYTKGLNSTVSIYDAKNINESNIWTIGFYLKEKEIDESLSTLLRGDMSKIYEISLEKLKKTKEKTKLFYKTIFKNNLITTKNYFYNATLKTGINYFFSLYNESFDAKNTILTFDYEPLYERPKPYGIEFVKEYLSIINIENVICQKFDSSKREKLLKNIYDDYENLPINILEHIIITAVILEYLNKDPFSLEPNKINYVQIYNESKEKEKFLKKLTNSYTKLKAKITTNSKIENYLDKCFPTIKLKIIYLVTYNNLESFFESDKQEEIIYYTNENLNEKEYLELLKKIKSSKEKNIINIIAEKNLSIYDLSMLIEDANLNDQELFSLFSNLRTFDIMALKKYYISTFKENPVLDTLNRYVMTKNNTEKNIINYKYNLLKIVEKM